MKNTNAIATTLTANYGFEARPNCLFAGRGSWITGGTTIEIAFGGEMVSITRREWLWNCDGECEYDRTTAVTCHLSQLWENLPEWVLRR